MNAAVPSAASPRLQTVDLRNLSFRRLDAAGEELAPGITEGHVITHFPALGLMFDVRPWAEVGSLKEAQAKAAECDLLGRKGEWVIGEDVEVAALINRRFRAPAVDPSAAPNAPSNDWIYTSTPLKGSSVRVWFVCLGGGGVGWLSAGNDGLVVPVLRVPPSQ